ncbi:hypothetical protein KC878_01860 [Candidatus Saccharibacteria bacterium]|nr:hypothetical protein [Candidatus Saccharibacteria bacterium]
MGAKIKRLIKVLIVVSLSFMGFAGSTFAQTSSTNYSLSEVLIGSGGVLDASSASFRAKASLGDLVVGNSGSTAYQIFGGFTTTDAPYLEFYVDPSGVDFVTIDTDCSSNGYADFYVRAFLTSGYVVTATGGDLTSENSDTITTSTTPAACVVNQEFFGINLVANTGFGLDPEQVPDPSFSFGDAATGYDTADVFQFNDGDTIAESLESTGQTNYRISYIANASPITEAGQYQATHVLIATATY